MAPKKPESSSSRSRSPLVPRTLKEAAQAPATDSASEPWRARRRKTRKKSK